MLKIVAVLILVLTVTVFVFGTYDRSANHAESMMAAGPVALAAAEEPGPAERDRPALIEPSGLGATNVADEAVVAVAGRGTREGEGAGQTTLTTQSGLEWVTIPGTPIGVWPKPRS